MRPIDGDALSEWILGQCKSPSCPKSECAFGIRIMKHIDRMPSAQPEIIRCKDCEWHGGASYCCNTDIHGFFSDDFCSYAERRTNENQ